MRRWTIWDLKRLVVRHTPRWGPNFFRVAANKIRNEYEFRRNSTALKSLPWNVILETTKNCNLSCPMCRDFIPYDPTLDMPMDMLEGVVDRLAPTTDVLDVRSQGEAMIAKTWDRVLDKVGQHRCKYEIVTNGTRLSQDRCDKLARFGFRVVVSFDGATAETFEKIRRGARFNSVIEGVQRLCDAYRHAGRPRQILAFQVTAQRDNLGEIPDIVRLAAKFGIGVVKIHGINSGGGLGLENFLDKAPEVFAEAERLGRELGLVHVETPSLAATQARNGKKLDTRCREPWKTINIAHDGNVRACCILYMNPLGNLKEQTLEEIWNGPDYQELRRTINGPNPPPPCATCPAANRGLS
jgi:radical SAM protein with 4Fe4S-binding SPASM domain